MYESGAWQRDGRDMGRGQSHSMCDRGDASVLGSHKVMFDLELGTPMSQSHRNAVALTPGSIYRATSPDAEDTHFN